MQSKKNITAFGEAPMLGLLFKFYVPAFIATGMNALYNVVDRIFVGNWCGSEGLAAITVCMSPTLMLLAFGMLIGQGSATLLSIRLGQQRLEDAGKILGQAFAIFFIMYAFVLSFGVYFTRDILEYFGAEGNVLEYATRYYRIILAGFIFEHISFGINNIIRAEGKPIYSMITIILGTSLNILLDWLFIIKFNWNVEGAALATVISQACATMWVMRFYLKKLGYVPLKLTHCRIYFKLIKSVIAVGSPAFIIQILAAFVTMLMILQASKFGGSSGIAIMGVIMTANLLVIMPIIGMNMGAQPIYGYNWGAKNFDRVKLALKYTLFFTSIVSLFAFVIFFVFSNQIFSIFIHNEKEIIESGSYAMRIMIFAFIFAGFNISVSSFFQSTGRPKFSIFLTVFRQIVTLAPLIILLPGIFKGIFGLWLAYPLSDLFTAIYSVFIMYFEFKRLNKFSEEKNTIKNEA